MPYKLPPQHRQFRPGESGNPGGRPRKTPSFREDLAKELAATVTINEGGKELVVSKQLAIAKALVQAAVKGDARAWTAVIALSEKESPHAEASAANDDALFDEFIEREVKRRMEHTSDGSESR